MVTVSYKGWFLLLLLIQEFSWKLRDLDKAAGLALNTGEASTTWSFSSFFDWNPLNMPPPVTHSFLIPKVAHMELFAASLGSSILNVFGTRTDPFLCLEGDSSCKWSCFSATTRECFPSVGELGPELGDLGVGAEWCECCEGNHGMFQNAAG